MAIEAIAWSLALGNWTYLPPETSAKSLPIPLAINFLSVSITNSCEYCIRSNTSAAKKKGATDQMIKEMIDVVGLANQNNKLVESYQVEVDKIYK